MTDRPASGAGINRVDFLVYIPPARAFPIDKNQIRGARRWLSATSSRSCSR
jgi:hypothetical protein